MLVMVPTVNKEDPYKTTRPGAESALAPKPSTLASPLRGNLTRPAAAFRAVSRKHDALVQSLARQPQRNRRVDQVVFRTATQMSHPRRDANSRSRYSWPC